MPEVRYPVVELRQYRLHPGQREVLISLLTGSSSRLRKQSAWRSWDSSGT